MHPTLTLLQADTTQVAGDGLAYQTFQVLGWSILFVGLIIVVTLRSRRYRDKEDDKR